MSPMNNSLGSILAGIIQIARLAGGRVVFVALVLWFTLVGADIPAWVRATILAALTYLLLPIDTIPDFLFPLGYTDDLAMLLGAFSAVSAFVTADDIQKARSLTAKLLGSEPDMELPPPTI